MAEQKIPNLEDAIRLAAAAHYGQKDKAGAPYILHPLKVMVRMGAEVEMIVAVLHDVIEDTPHTLAELQSLGYPVAIIEAIECLTHRDNETYEQYIQRLKGNELARKVKLADLEDNMDIRRLREPLPQDWERLKKYRNAWKELTGKEEFSEGGGL